jgi:hypothetical protein
MKFCWQCKHPVDKHGVVGCLMKCRSEKKESGYEFCQCDVSIKDFEGQGKVKKKKRGVANELERQGHD